MRTLPYSKNCPPFPHILFFCSAFSAFSVFLSQSVSVCLSASLSFCLSYTHAAQTNTQHEHNPPQVLHCTKPSELFSCLFIPLFIPSISPSPSQTSPSSTHTSTSVSHARQYMRQHTPPQKRELLSFTFSRPPFALRVSALWLVRIPPALPSPFSFFSLLFLFLFLCARDFVFSARRFVRNSAFSKDIRCASSCRDEGLGWTWFLTASRAKAASTPFQPEPKQKPGHSVRFELMEQEKRRSLRSKPVVHFTSFASFLGSFFPVAGAVRCLRLVTVFGRR